MKTRTHTCTTDDNCKSFKEEEALDSQELSHEEEAEEVIHIAKEFKCLKCDRVLSTKQSLKEHSYTHSGKKPFRCTEVGCGKTFRQSSQLCNHRKVHKEARMMLKRQAEKQRKGLKVFNQEGKNQEQKISFNLKGNVKVTLPPIRSPDVGVLLPSFSSIF